MGSYLKNKILGSVCLLFIFSICNLAAEDLNSDPFNQDEYYDYISQSVKGRHVKHKFKASQKKKNLPLKFKSWSPRWVWTDQLQSNKDFFFQTNVGVGFLYFSGVRANLGGRPSGAFASPLPNFTDVPFKGSLKYNRAPLFEYQMGARILPWLKAGLSYQHQGNLTVNTEALLSAKDSSGKAMLTSHLNLDALMAKVYLELPWAMVIQNVATMPYLGLGIGAGWQSWTRTWVQYLDAAGLFRNRYLSLNDKYSPNVVWMSDLGLRFLDADARSNFSIILGCKNIWWGQARNVGSMQDQMRLKLSLANSFRIKTLFSFTPYLGVQWDFPCSSHSKIPLIIDRRVANSWTPFWVGQKALRDPGFRAKVSGGIGFLYFGKTQGTAVADGESPTANVGRPIQYTSIEGAFSYNRTPLLEMEMGWRLLPWMTGGIAVQSQSQISLQSQWQYSTGIVQGGQTQHLNRLMADISLNSIMLKATLETPGVFVFKALAFRPFIGVGGGPSWQTWTNITVQDVIFNPGNRRNNNPRFLSPKISSNASLLVDMGLNGKSVHPDCDLSLSTGIKFNYWGRARNIGDSRQQGGSNQSLVRPLSTNIWSFAPYVGILWNFPVTANLVARQTIDNRSVNTWKPFVTASSNIEDESWLWTQFNMGVGMLYFSGIHGNLAGVPGSAYNYERASDKIQGKLKYNRTPLYEYLLGVRINDWAKIGLDYLHQAGVNIQSTPQRAFVPGANTNPLSKLTFRSNLQLDGLLAKGEFFLPYSAIFKSIAITPFGALGVGFGWQTWEAVVQHVRLDTGYINYISEQPLKRKISFNAIWTLDLGMRLKSSSPRGNFSVNLGCKYAQWGQARNIGLFDQQGSLESGISQPFRVQTLYQFAPYLGLEWLF